MSGVAPLEEADLTALWKYYDKDKNGVISRIELENLLDNIRKKDSVKEALPSSFIDEVENLLDRNHGGHIAFVEFKSEFNRFWVHRFDMYSRMHETSGTQQQQSHHHHHQKRVEEPKSGSAKMQERLVIMIHLIKLHSSKFIELESSRRRIEELEKELASLRQYGDPKSLSRQNKELQDDISRLRQYGDPEMMSRRIKQLEDELSRKNDSGDPAELWRKIRDLEGRLAEATQYGDPADMKRKIRELEKHTRELEDELERMSRHGDPDALARKIKNLELQLEELGALENDYKARLESERQKAQLLREEGAAEWSNKCNELTMTIKMMSEKHERERGDLARELSESRSRLNEKVREIDEIASSHRSEMDKLRDAHNRHRTEKDEELDRITASHKALLEAEILRREEEHESTLRNLSASHAAEREGSLREIQENYQRKLEEWQRKHETALRKKKTQHEEVLRSLRETHRQQLEQASREWQDAHRSALEDHTENHEKAAREHEKHIRELKDRLRGHQELLETKDRQHAEYVNSLRETHRGELATMKGEWEERHENGLNQQELEHARMLEMKEREHQEEIARRAMEHEEMLRRKQKEHETAIAHSQKAANDMEAVVRRLEKDMEMLNEKLEEARTRAHGRTGELEAQWSRHARIYPITLSQDLKQAFLRKERDLTRKFEGRLAESMAEYKNLDADYNELLESKKDLEAELQFCKRQKCENESKILALRSVTESELKKVRAELGRERVRWTQELLPQNLRILMSEVEFLYEQSQNDVAQVRRIRRLLALVGRYLEKLSVKGLVDVRIFESSDDLDEGGAIWRAIDSGFGGLESLKNANEEMDGKMTRMEQAMQAMIQRLAYEEARSEQLERLLASDEQNLSPPDDVIRVRASSAKSIKNRSTSSDCLRQKFLDKLVLAFGTIEAGFRRLDFNTTGKVCLHELQMFSGQLGLCSETLTDIFFRLDRGRKGYLTRADLLKSS
ncbi:hypothetical protein FOL47_010591 [Perkinsus chesapeaki]|uniref:EF-hand domain-containing protein n=1 Tax=Perkinsus chesapeaki TaxID=330153 RepID=A0A7J6L169_PERCH|nr:hypothetical protein FOL47_010591 [Perkinsus chesapeaki]